VVRLFHHWCSRRKIVLFVVELAVATAVAALIIALAAGAGAGQRALHSALACCLVFQGALYFGDLYDPGVAAKDRAEGARLLRTLAWAALVLSALALTWARSAPAPVLLAGAAGAAAALILTRSALPAILGAPERVLLYGCGTRVAELVRAIERDAEGEFEVAGRWHGPGIEEAARRLGAQVVVAAADEGSEVLPSESLLRLKLRGVRVLGATDFAERALRRLPVSHLEAGELAFSDGFREGRLDAFAKRAFDLAAAIGLGIASAPLIGLAALLVRLDSPGPVFYRQERVGRGGRLFVMTKLRTMRADAEADGLPRWARPSDGRVTRMGRLLRKARIDELPQIFAVIRGEMSFVGPRPERPFFVEQIKREVPFYALREEVKPGITGWAQIRYPYGASLEDARAKLEYDLYYLKNRSLFLDAAIVFHTVRHVLGRRGAR
jgi:exopolysaccharide biosynthesis polyprenyl glycosylphosphotransferase